MDDGREHAPDYEYDEAHDVPPTEVGSAGPAAGPPVSGAPPSTDADGDLGYDLAHDVPPA